MQLAGTHKLQFEVRAGLSRGASGDLILILFSNQSADTPLVPNPLFGEDILAEFAFSGRDAPPGKTLRFIRWVNDLSFLNARFIRVVNHGSDPWAGESITLLVDNKPVLSRQPLYPRKGDQKEGGIDKYNSVNWNAKSFWEGDLQRLRVDR